MRTAQYCAHLMLTGTVAVSELPGYPGRRHTQRSRYVTTEFRAKQ